MYADSRGTALKLALGPLLLVAFTGCSMSHGPSKDSVLVVPDEVVADVSSDQSLLASYAKVQLAGPGPLGGTLVVRPLPTGDPIFQVDGAFGAAFGQQGTTLLYFTGATTGLDASNPVDFGHPWVWTPTLGNAVPLAAGFVTVSIATPDHSLFLFLESTTPAAGVGGTLRLFRAADCAGGTCATTVIAQSAPIVRIAFAPDGQHAAYQEETKSADGSRVETITLVTIADGSTTPVATTSVPTTITALGDLFSFSPDGSLIATVAETNNGPLQSRVASTATGAFVPWVQQPGDLFTTGVGFSDSQTVFVAAIDPQSDSQIWRTTADTGTFFTTGSAFTISHAYPGTERYLAYTKADVGVLASNGPRPLSVVDLQANPMPIFPLTSLGSGTLTFSEDVSSAFTYEGFQAGNQSGTLVQIALPSGVRSTIAQNVYAGGTSYARGSSKILYFPTPDTRRSSGQAIVEWNGTGTQLEGFALNYVSVDNPPTLFWTLADPRALYRRPLQ